jgi:hypothetical protein
MECKHGSGRSVGTVKIIHSMVNPTVTRSQLNQIERFENPQI